MALHLIKLAVGIESVEHLMEVQRKRRKGGPKAVYHYTRHAPKRDAEVLAGGSMYWVIKGFIRVRQRIIGFDSEYFENEGKYCAIKMDRQLIATELQSRRAHQGWRYLEAEEAPNDLKRRGKAGSSSHDMPPEMMLELKQLGLL